MAKTTSATTQVKPAWTEGLPPGMAAKNTEMNVEYALNYLRGAKQAHMASFTDDEDVKGDLQWAVTGLLEHAIGLLDEHVYR